MSILLGFKIGSRTVLARLQVLQYFFRTAHNAQRHACQFCYMHTIAATNTSRGHAVQKNDFSLLIIANGHGVHP